MGARVVGNILGNDIGAKEADFSKYVAQQWAFSLVASGEFTSSLLTSPAIAHSNGNINTITIAIAVCYCWNCLIAFTLATITSIILSIRSKCYYNCAYSDYGYYVLLLFYVITSIQLLLSAFCYRCSWYSCFTFYDYDMYRCYFFC